MHSFFGLFRRQKNAALDAFDRPLGDEESVAIAMDADASDRELAAVLPRDVEELRERDDWLMGLVEAQHLVLPDTGHWLHVERPEEVAEAIRWCLERARMRS